MSAVTEQIGYHLKAEVRDAERLCQSHVHKLLKLGVEQMNWNAIGRVWIKVPRRPMDQITVDVS